MHQLCRISNPNEVLIIEMAWHNDPFLWCLWFPICGTTTSYYLSHRMCCTLYFNGLADFAVVRGVVWTCNANISGARREKPFIPYERNKHHTHDIKIFLDKCIHTYSYIYYAMHNWWWVKYWENSIHTIWRPIWLTLFVSELTCALVCTHIQTNTVSATQSTAHDE